jgi:exodeoxyribonuclease VII large subunit
VAAPARPVATRYGEREVYSVAELNKGLAGWVERLPPVWVEGEVAELRRRDAWAFAFWTLKDLGGTATVAVRMARTGFDRLPAPPVDGARIHLLARPEVSRRSGELSLRALRLEPFGAGGLLAQLEERRRRLAAEGLFAQERKRPLPRFPRTIGLVCGHDAAAKHDVVEGIRHRYPPARIVLAETVVQGDGAAGRIRLSLARLDADPAVDVIVLARGGGSLEDLAPFSDEALCRAIAACATPVVSAIGHEQDAPLCDLVADLRASTPTHAARLVVPDASALAREDDALRERGRRVLAARLQREREALALVAARPVLRTPSGFLSWRREGIGTLRERLRAAPSRRLERERRELHGAASQLRALGPASTLERGYAIALGPDGHAVCDPAQAPPGTLLDVRLARGRLAARVEGPA